MGAVVPAPVVMPDILALIGNSVLSEHSKRIYEAAILEFVTWCRSTAVSGFSKASLQEYRSVLVGRRLAPSSINVRLCAIRKLAAEMADNGMVPRDVAASIGKVKGVERSGIRSGKWLSVTEAEALLNAPSCSSLRGKRDRALLGMLIGAGLRRAEAASLVFTDIQERDGRWVIADLVGKRGHIRTVPIASWTKALVDDWRQAVGLAEGHVFRPVDKSGCVTGEALTPQTIFHIVRGYGAQIGHDIAPHDLRRTFARLAYKGRAGLEQIQLALGHVSLTTTERYLGVRLDLQDGACDHLGIRTAVSSNG